MSERTWALVFIGGTLLGSMLSVVFKLERIAKALEILAGVQP